MHRSKIQREQTYFVLLNNGEQQPFIQANSSAEAAALQQSQQYIIDQQLEIQQQPQAQQVQIHPDTFYDVIDYVKHLYADFATEKNLTQFYCLFCANEFNDMRLLIRHIAEVHRAKILDGTINLEQDFREIVRNKILSAERNRTVISTDSQLYQCGQCQQMFQSLDTIAEHFTQCQSDTQQQLAQTQPTEQLKVEPSMIMSPQTPKLEPSATNLHEIETRWTQLPASPNYQYLSTTSVQSQPYGCARCGRRWFTIYELSQHIIQCQDDVFYDSAKHLLPEFWVEAPKNQHIVINEDSTNVTLKTTGLWLMPEPIEPTDSSDSLRGFWVMPSSTTIFQDHQQDDRFKLSSTAASALPESVALAPPRNFIHRHESMHGSLPAPAAAAHTLPLVEATAVRSKKQASRTVKNANRNANSGTKRRRNMRASASAAPTMLVAKEFPPEQHYAGYECPTHSNNNAASDIKILDVVNIQNESYSYAMGTLDEQNALQSAIHTIVMPTESSQRSSVFTEASTSTNISGDIAPNTNGSNNDFSGYNIDDLSHLDKPIVSTKPTPALQPLQSKPQFVDSFFSFLMSRDTNKS